MSRASDVRVYSCWMLIMVHGWNGLNMPENSRHWNSPPQNLLNIRNYNNNYQVGYSSVFEHSL